MFCYFWLLFSVLNPFRVELNSIQHQDLQVHELLFMSNKEFGGSDLGADSHFPFLLGHALFAHNVSFQMGGSLWINYVSLQGSRSRWMNACNPGQNT